MPAGTSTRTRLPLQDRLLDKARRDRGSGCWVFTGAVLKKSGYGQLAGPDGRVWLAHRISYHLFCGPIPDGGMVLHRCDNRRCVNPTHLFPGDGKANMRDAVAKNRHAAGERHGLAKLCAESVAEIRGLLAEKVPPAAIAAIYGVSPPAIRDIRSGRRWRSTAGTE